jgi:hypothetical protein
MILLRRLAGCDCWIAVVLAIVGFAQGARAQDQDVVEDDVAAAPVGGAMIVQQPNVDQVDNWVFGRFGGAAVARGRFDAALALRIDDLERTLGMTEAQKKKLKLAGRGDIKRVFDRVEELKRKFRLNQNDPQSNIWQAMQPLQVEINAGLFGESSIFQKTIAKTLTSDQVSRYESLIRERRLNRYRATVEWFVVHLDKALGLSDDQRRRFTELILSETEPPLRFGQYDYWYLMFQVAKLPESKSKPIFDAPQWRLLSRQFAQGRGMEQWLKTNGVFPDHKQAGGETAILDPGAIPAMPFGEVRIWTLRARASSVAPVRPDGAAKKGPKREKAGLEKKKN